MDRSSVAASSRVAETIGALCMTAVVLGMVAGVLTGVIIANGYHVAGMDVPLAERAHLLTFGTTLLFAGVLLVGVLVLILAARWVGGAPSLFGTVTLAVAVLLGVLVLVGTGLDLWGYAAQHSGPLFWPMALRAASVVPAVAAIKLAWSRAVRYQRVSTSTAALAPRPTV